VISFKRWFDVKFGNFDSVKITCFIGPKMETIKINREKIDKEPSEEILRNNLINASGIKSIGIRKPQTSTYKIDFSKSFNFFLAQILFRAGILNHESLTGGIDDLIKRLKEAEHKAFSISMDTNILFSNFAFDLLQKTKVFYNWDQERASPPLFLTTQAMQYELHHMTSATIPKLRWLKPTKDEGKHIDKSLKLPLKLPDFRARFGMWGRVQHERIIRQHPHILAQSPLPPMYLKFDGEASLSTPYPTSPYYDSAIIEQIRQFLATTNVHSVFYTGDYDLFLTAQQGGLDAYYVDKPHEIPQNFMLKSSRELLWLLLHLLIESSCVKIEIDDHPAFYMAMIQYKKERGYSIYFRTSDKAYHTVSLSYDDRVY
jgi:hypothetical protein